MIYPIKTLSQLPLILKGFRKEKGLTQAAMAEKLGITQQSYAYFEANPATATLERLFMVLRQFDVEISLDHTPPATNAESEPSATLKATTPGTVAISQTKPSAIVKARRIVAPSGKKESW